MKKLLCLALTLCMLAACIGALAAEKPFVGGVATANVQMDAEKFAQLYGATPEELTAVNTMMRIIERMDVQVAFDEAGSFRALLLAQGQQVMELQGKLDAATGLITVASDFFPHYALQMPFISNYTINDKPATAEEMQQLMDFMTLLQADMMEIIENAPKIITACDVLYEGVQFVQKTDLTVDMLLLSQMLLKGIERLREHPEVAELLNIAPEDLDMLETDINDELEVLLTPADEAATLSEPMNMSNTLIGGESADEIRAWFDAVMAQPTESYYPFYVLSLHTNAQGDAYYMTMSSAPETAADLTVFMPPEGNSIQVRVYENPVSIEMDDLPAYLACQMDIQMEDEAIALDAAFYLDASGVTALKLHLTCQPLSEPLNITMDLENLTVLDAQSMTAEESALLNQDMMQYGFVNAFVKLVSVMPEEASEFLSSIMQ